MNVRTGKMSSARSIVHFCKRHTDLGGNAKYHLTPVLKHERLHYKGWMLPKTYQTIDVSKVKEIRQILVASAVI